MKKQLEDLLYVLHWASSDKRDGRSLSRIELSMLRRQMYHAYKALGFSDEDLPECLRTAAGMH